MMERAGQPLTLAALATKLRIKPGSPSESLQKRLRAMVRDGQLLRNRARKYCLTDHLDLVTGVIQAHRDGFGFLAPDDGSEDVYLAASEMSSLWNRDRIAVRVSPSPRGGREGRLVEVLERVTNEVVGTFVRDKGIDVVVREGEPEARVLIPRGQSGGARSGDIVRAAIVQHPTNPFVLVVFSNNNTSPNLIGRGSVMIKIADMVYEYFDGLGR